MYKEIGQVVVVVVVGGVAKAAKVSFCHRRNKITFLMAALKVAGSNNTRREGACAHSLAHLTLEIEEERKRQNAPNCYHKTLVKSAPILNVAQKQYQ